ncbi:MAG: type II toxin-antitoxin system VapC family toxin [Gammaproteobacteria bacterium]|nr:type II toxin-antitoxin system VapC family toxin [Gammaproteobacteria bacterium]MDE0452621.1 type II toxin-antitoxin system VapC family toxin [Gammaproteobacteria bacterium]
MRILLDSNAYSHLKRGHPRIAEIVRSSEQILLPFVVIGELLYGFRHGTRLERNLGELYAFLENPRVATPAMNLTTADRYARIATALRTKARPIPSNDIWIAAHAMETGADLISSDSHFEFVDGLAWIHVAVD